MLKRILRWGLGAIVLALLVAVPIAYWTSSNTCDDPSTPPANPMKAVVYCDYGSADVLKLEDVERPTPADDQVLVKVHAVSLNPLDWHYMEGTPYLMRLGAGLRKPKVIRLGVDFSGTVEAVGSQVTRFKPGDEVFGGKTGAVAEYVTVRESGAVVLKPANVTFEQAAAIPIAAVTALQGLRDKGKIQPGQKVLINGASGGVGTFAVQIAKAFGANVTGVCSTRNVDLVRSLGADQVIDYTKADFTQSTERYDLMLDNVGNRSLSESRHILGANGKYVMVGGSNETKWLGPLGRVIGIGVVSRFVSQEMRFFIASLNQADLAVLADLIHDGKVTPVVDRQYKLSEISAAMRYLEEGHARGKVVVTFE